MIEPAASTTEPAPTPGALVVRGLSRRFGGFRALAEVDLDVPAGSVLGLVGPNGSGKTTLINVVSGVYPPSEGTVSLDGREIGGLPPARRVHLGLNRTFQVPEPFASLTVAENLAVAARYGRRGEPRRSDVLHEAGLAGLADRLAGSLNASQQKRLDLARALTTNPSVLCVDELGAGLAREELAELAAYLRRLTADGITLVVVEHLLGFLEQLTDSVVVLSGGGRSFVALSGTHSGTPTLSGCSSVGEVPGGPGPGARGEPTPSAPIATGGGLLEVEHLEVDRGNLQVLWGVDLDVDEGELVVVLGANGAGKSTLLGALGGHLPLRRGRIHFDGVDVSRSPASRRACLGLTLMTEQGVFADLSVRENLRLGAWRLGRREARRAIEEVLERFDELARRLSSPAGSLSGGQRKLLGLAEAPAGRPRLLVLDEPSAGLSPPYVKGVVSNLATIRRDGPAVLLAEQNVAFFDLADRVVVLEGGRVRFSGSVGELRTDSALADAFLGLEG